MYLWNAGSGGVEELCTCPIEGDYISSVAWGADGAYLAVGTSDAKVWHDESHAMQSAGA